MKEDKVERLLSELERGEQVTIVARGDSNAELTFHTRGHLPWPYLLQEALYEKKPRVTAGEEWPNSGVGEVAKKIVELGKGLNVPVVDHCKFWMEADVSHDGPPTTNPGKLWMRMSDAFHPGSTGYLAFYRDLAPFLDCPGNYRGNRGNKKHQVNRFMF